jgi:hypothetical protein
MAVLVDGPPQIVTFAIDRKKYLVEVPLITWPRTPATKLIGIGLAEFATPLVDGFVGHCDPCSKSSSSTSR